MDQSYQLYLFILSTTTLFIDVKSTEDFSHNWFDAQKQCLGPGLTIEKNKSNQPYWTGVYRRLTPWVNILGCYSDSIESLQDVVKKTMSISSVGMCQEICHQENIDQFAVQIKKCLCIEHEILNKPIHRLPPSDCYYKCEDKSGECGGGNAYNIYETQGVYFNSKEKCLSLQCSAGDTRFIPEECSKPFKTVCENMELPDNKYTWSLSMEHCKQSQPSTYLLGDFNLSNPHPVCARIPGQLQVVWVGVARQIYTSIDQGWGIMEEHIITFIECQMCRNSDCRFRRCSDSFRGSIFCKSISDTSQSQITEHLTTSQESFSASTLLSSHSISDELFVSTSTTGNYDTDQSPSANDAQQLSSTSDGLVLKISLPLTFCFIVVSTIAVGMMFYSRRFKAKNTDTTTKVKVESGTRKTVDSYVDCVQNNSYFVLEQCPQYILKGSDSSNDSPYNNTEEGVYDHLRDKKTRKPELEDTYQHASAGVSRDMSEYDTMANAVNKTQEENTSYDYSHQDSNGNYACDLRANNHLTDDPYDIAT